MSWSELPRELVAHIVGYLSHDALKSFRQTNKVNFVIATPAVFETIHLSPNFASFERARHVARSKTLSHHVRALIYHLNVLGEHDREFDSFRDKLFQYHNPENMRKTVREYYTCWLEEIDNQRNFNQEVDYENDFDLFCQEFKQLDAIATAANIGGGGRGKPTNYIERKTGMPLLGLNREPNVFAQLLNSTNLRRLKSISGDILAWDTFLNAKREIFLEGSLARLQHLELCFLNYEFFDNYDPEERNVLYDLSRFLANTPSLISLKLEFDCFPADGTRGEFSPIAHTFTTLHWKHLRELDLFGVCCSEARLFNFLKSHRETLQNLHLGEVELVVDEKDGQDHEDEGDSGSILTLFRNIAENLKLNHIRLNGVFTNRVTQAWCMVQEEDRKPGDIPVQLEQYMARKIGCPFPEQLLTTTLSNQDDSMAALRQNFKDFTDSACIWIPELLE